MVLPENQTKQQPKKPWFWSSRGNTEAEEHVKRFHGDAISKIQIVGNYGISVPASSTNKLQGK